MSSVRATASPASAAAAAARHGDERVAKLTGEAEAAAEARVAKIAELEASLKDVASVKGVEIRGRDVERAVRNVIRQNDLTDVDRLAVGVAAADHAVLADVDRGQITRHIAVLLRRAGRKFLRGLRGAGEIEAEVDRRRPVLRGHYGYDAARRRARAERGGDRPDDGWRSWDGGSACLSCFLC